MSNSSVPSMKKRVVLWSMGLAAIMLVLGGLFIAGQSYPNYVRRRCLVELESMGFHAEQWESGTDLIEVHGSVAMSQMSQPEESGDFPLTTFTRIDAIWCGLKSTAMPTDDVLTHVGRFPEIQELNVTCPNRITGSGFRYLVEHTRLKRLFILNGALRDNHLHYVSRLQNIEAIDFTNQPISDSGLVGLSRLTKVRQLSLSGTRVKGRFLKSAAYRNEIESLELADTDLDDQGMSQIQTLANLKYVDLTGCKSDIETVARLKSRGVIVELDSKAAKTYRKWRRLPHDDEL